MQKPLRALALALVFGSMILGCGGSLPASKPHPLLDKAPDAIEQLTLEGEMVKFPQKGKVTVLDFWSTNCKPCVKMMPELQALYAERKGAGLSMVGVAIDDNPGLVTERLKKMGVTYVNVLDDSGSTIRGAYQVSDLPQTFIFDRKGQLRVVTQGGDEKEVAAIRDAVDFLLSEPTQ
ncbi:MAG: TlpA family protein disulfide reductase [Myxococcales bacterium]|nr:TlpA family protein disulfide reductase [Myxococcales bacterium]